MLHDGLAVDMTVLSLCILLYWSTCSVTRVESLFVSHPAGNSNPLMATQRENEEHPSRQAP